MPSVSRLRRVPRLSEECDETARIGLREGQPTPSTVPRREVVNARRGPKKRDRPRAARASPAPRAAEEIGIKVAGPASGAECSEISRISRTIGTISFDSRSATGFAERAVPPAKAPSHAVLMLERRDTQVGGQASRRSGRLHPRRSKVSRRAERLTPREIPCQQGGAAERGEDRRFRPGRSRQAAASRSHPSQWLYLRRPDRFASAGTLSGVRPRICRLRACRDSMIRCRMSQPHRQSPSSRPASAVACRSQPHEQAVPGLHRRRQRRTAPAAHRCARSQIGRLVGRRSFSFVSVILRYLRANPARLIDRAYINGGASERIKICRREQGNARYSSKSRPCGADNIA